MDLIYLDHNSTTPLADEAAAAMGPWLGQRFGNPSSQHQVGRRARQALEEARDGIGQILGASLAGPRPDRIVLTSGGTEANNLALFSLAGLNDPAAAPGEAIVSAIEHSSVLKPVALLERRGWTIHKLGVSTDGVVDVSGLDRWLTERTRFVSVMLANNETGVIQNVRQIAARAAALGVPMHTDAAQMAGKLPLDFRELGCSSMSIAAHKFHGPIGIGALIARHETSLAPVLVGGSHQEGLRPGTESVALAVGMHAALAAFGREGPARAQRLRRLRDRLERGLQAGCEGRIVVHGAAAERLPQTSAVGFMGIDRQALLMALDLAGVACSAGSACASGSSEPSHVLAAMGASRELLDGSVRFSLGATTTEAEIDEAIVRILGVCRAINAARKTRSAGSPAPRS